MGRAHGQADRAQAAGTYRPWLGSKLYEYLGNHDLVQEVQGQGPVADPLRRVLENVRDYHVRSVDDVLWLRVLDVVAAFEARGYQHYGRLLLGVGDRMGVVAGTYLFEVADSRATGSAWCNQGKNQRMFPGWTCPNASLQVCICMRGTPERLTGYRQSRT